MKKVKWFVQHYLNNPHFHFDIQFIIPNTMHIFKEKGFSQAIRYFKFSLFYTFYEYPNCLYKRKINEQKRLYIIQNARIDRFMSYLQNNIDKFTSDELLEEIQIGVEDIAINSYFRRTRL